MLPYVSKSFRRVTFALFSPNPTGVSSGPFRTTRVFLIDSSVSCGTPEAMPFLNTLAPAWRSSHSTRAPAASTIRRAALLTSWPMPSPGISVTSVRPDEVTCTFLSTESTSPTVYDQGTAGHEDRQTAGRRRTSAEAAQAGARLPERLRRLTGVVRGPERCGLPAREEASRHPFDVR